MFGDFLDLSLFSVNSTLNSLKNVQVITRFPIELGLITWKSFSTPSSWGKSDYLFDKHALVESSLYWSTINWIDDGRTKSAPCEIKTKISRAIPRKERTANWDQTLQNDLTQKFIGTVFYILGWLVRTGYLSLLWEQSIFYLGFIEPYS